MGSWDQTLLEASVFEESLWFGTWIVSGYYPNSIWILVLSIGSNYLDTIWIVFGYFEDSIQILSGSQKNFALRNLTKYQNYPDTIPIVDVLFQIFFILALKTFFSHFLPFIHPQMGETQKNSGIICKLSR